MALVLQTLRVAAFCGVLLLDAEGRPLEALSLEEARERRRQLDEAIGATERAIAAPSPEDDGYQ